MDVSVVNSGFILWLALGLTGIALIVIGVIVYRGRRTIWVRSLAVAAVGMGVVMWAGLIITLPVSRSAEYNTDPVFSADLAEPNLAVPAEARVQGSYGSRGDLDGNFIQILKTNMDLDQLLTHYQQQIRQKGWGLSPVLRNENLAVLTWTYFDGNQPIRSIMTITAARHGNWMVSETFVGVSR